MADSFAEWYWKCRLQAYFFMAVSLVLMVLSFMVVWSECLFFIKSPVLSLFAVFIDLARHNYDYAYIEVREGWGGGGARGWRERKRDRQTN